MTKRNLDVDATDMSLLVCGCLVRAEGIKKEKGGDSGMSSISGKGKANTKIIDSSAVL